MALHSLPEQLRQLRKSLESHSTLLLQPRVVTFPESSVLQVSVSLTHRQAKVYEGSDSQLESSAEVQE